MLSACYNAPRILSLDVGHKLNGGQLSGSERTKLRVSAVVLRRRVVPFRCYFRLGVKS